MKATKLLIVLLTLSSMVLMPSCKKKSTPTPTPAPVVTAKAPFSWKENGGATKTLSTASLSLSGYYLTASNADMSTLIKIQLTDAIVGTYPINTSTSGSSFKFIYGGTYEATSGNIVITSYNASGKVSGTFNTSSTTGPVTTVVGQFNNIDAF